jgi:hypothetical protein
MNYEGSIFTCILSTYRDLLHVVFVQFLFLIIIFLFKFVWFYDAVIDVWLKISGFLSIICESSWICIVLIGLFGNVG